MGLQPVDDLLHRFASAFEVDLAAQQKSIWFFFPINQGLRDERQYRGLRVAFYSNLTSLLYSLHITLDGGFVSDPHCLSSPSGPVAVAVLVNAGVLKVFPCTVFHLGSHCPFQLSPALAAKIESGDEIPANSEMVGIFGEQGV